MDMLGQLYIVPLINEYLEQEVANAICCGEFVIVENMTLHIEPVFILIVHLVYAIYHRDTHVVIVCTLDTIDHIYSRFAQMQCHRSSKMFASRFIRKTV